MARQKKIHHTWPQRIILGVNITVAIGCLVGGGVLVYANQQLANRKVVTITSNKLSSGNTGVDGLPVGDLSAKNFLITGRDNNSCADPGSPTAEQLNERPKYTGLTDTIMLIRVDPTNNQAAVLSFPRDLYVEIANSDHRNRINTAYRPKDPNRLIDTIRSNFDIGVDHYVSIDFCAFKSIVDAVGGVRIPFLYPARDRRSGFRVSKAGCARLNGDKALAYVRSRNYSYFDATKNKWIPDYTSDWGRIARQQDFIRRVLRAALDKGASNPAVANNILSSTLKNVITDDQLSPLSMLQLARAMRNVTEGNVHTYTVEGFGKNIGGQSVIEPLLKSDTMTKILEIFQGKALISPALISPALISPALNTSVGTQSLATAPTKPTLQLPTTTLYATTTTTVPTGAEVTSTTALAQELVQQRLSIVPPDDPTCR